MDTSIKKIYFKDDGKVVNLPLDKISKLVGKVTGKEYALTCLSADPTKGEVILEIFGINTFKSTAYSDYLDEDMKEYKKDGLFNLITDMDHITAILILEQYIDLEDVYKITHTIVDYFAEYFSIHKLQP